jgi:hypothetical protein
VFVLERRRRRIVGRRKHNNKPQHDETVDGLCIVPPPSLVVYD